MQMIDQLRKCIRFIIAIPGSPSEAKRATGASIVDYERMGGGGGVNSISELQGRILLCDVRKNFHRLSPLGESQLWGVVHLSSVVD